MNEVIPKKKYRSYILTAAAVFLIIMVFTIFYCNIVFIKPHLAKEHNSKLAWQTVQLLRTQARNSKHTLQLLAAGVKPTNSLEAGTTGFSATRLGTGLIRQNKLSTALEKAYSIYPFTTTIVLLIGCVIIALAFLTIAILFLISRARTKKQLMKLAYVDSLTGCGNASAFREKAELLLAKNSSYAYVVFDINRFKAINNTYGYKEGNKLLLFVSQQVAAYVAEDEVFARSSDDNFTLLLCFDSESALKNRLKALFEGMNIFCTPYGGNSYHLNYACGVYVIPLDVDTALDAYYENAQLAKKTVKELYDTTVCFYDDVLRQKEIEIQEIEASMYKALENGEFEVYLQPKYNLRTETVAGAEALIRWNHPEKGFLTPDRFISIFEHNGFLLKLDCYVYDSVCHMIRDWMDAGETPFPVAVNMSRLHVRQEGFAELLSDMAKHYDIPSQLIEIELTETAFFEDTQQIIDVMHQLKDKGFQLSMDDFGSGYSSLNLLNVLPVDIIKLDRMMFNDSGKTERGRKVVTNAIHIVRDLEMKAVAEGVETKEQVDFLKNIDCDMVQGFFYAKPMPIAQFELLAYGRDVKGRKLL